jgi:hypothetical protein
MLTLTLATLLFAVPANPAAPAAKPAAIPALPAYFRRSSETRAMAAQTALSATEGQACFWLR